MKTKMILIRHGETEWNVLCKFLGTVDLPLNEKGRRQARCVKDALKDEKIDVAYSSPMKRACETGEIILEGRNVKIITDDGFREISCGKWEGMDGKEVEKRFPVQLYLWGHCPEECKIEGGDTFQEVSDRIVEAFWRIVNNNRGKTILITSHMICLALLMVHFSGKRINDIWKVKPICNAALNCIEISENNQVEITVWSDDCFIPEEDRIGNALIAGRNCVEE